MEPVFEYVLGSPTVDSVTMDDGVVVVLGRLVQNVDWPAHAIDRVGEDQRFSDWAGSDGFDPTVEFQDGDTFMVHPAEIGALAVFSVRWLRCRWVDRRRGW